LQAKLFGGWTAEQRKGSDYVEALTQVDVRVDVQALRLLVAGRLAAIQAGAGVQEADLQWPGIHKAAQVPASSPPAAASGGPVPPAPQQQQQSGKAPQQARQQVRRPATVQWAKRLLDVNPAPDNFPPCIWKQVTGRC